METSKTLTADSRFRRQARRFARAYAEERRAVFELGKIAAGWLEHYSRSRNAERLAEALHEVTGLRITGRSILYYRDVFLLDKSWRASPLRKRPESRNHFQIRHVGPGHLRVVSGAKLTESKQHDLLDEVERGRLTVKQTTARARQFEVEVNRAKRAVRCRPGAPRVIRGDAIEVVRRLKPGSIHHLFADWQWEILGVWRDVGRRQPVHRPADPVEHLCRFLRVARRMLNQQCIVWVFSKATAFPGGQIGLPWAVQETAYDVGLRYCAEYVFQRAVAGYRSGSGVLAVKHTPIFAFVPEGFDFSPVHFLPSVSQPLRSASRASHIRTGTEKHPHEKPVALFEDLISAGTPGGQVFDAFAGSGAAGIAAVRQGCPYMGAELQPFYARTANRAIATALADCDSNVRSA